MILRSENIVFIVKGLILLIGFPTNKYHPNTKNYLPCLLIGGEGGGRLVLGGRDYLGREVKNCGSCDIWIWQENLGEICEMCRNHVQMIANQHLKMYAYTLQSKSSGVCFRCPCLKSCSLVYMILHQPTQAELQAKPSPCLGGMLLQLNWSTSVLEPRCNTIILLNLWPFRRRQKTWPPWPDLGLPIF